MTRRCTSWRERVSPKTNKLKGRGAVGRRFERPFDPVGTAQVVLIPGVRLQPGERRLLHTQGRRNARRRAGWRAQRGLVALYNPYHGGGAGRHIDDDRPSHDLWAGRERSGAGNNKQKQSSHK